jgi:CDP-diacylglycerol--glycerol-3-phosphate 3-phosphatidyltransferase
MLVSFRAALGPVLVVIAARWRSGTPLVVCIVMALASDAFDGILARRWQIDTENLRRWDTRADTMFYACVLLAILLRNPKTIAHHWIFILALIGAEIVQHLFALFKYQRHASYHSILSKVWGLWMAAAMIALLGFGMDNWFLDFVFGWGILCNLQGLAMSLLLPEWQRDVPTLFHAWRLRAVRQNLSHRNTAPSRAWW